MGRIRNALISMIVVSCLSPIICMGQSFDTEISIEGYEIEGRYQVEQSPIEVPHADKVPESPKVTQPITSYEEYYARNMEGYRGEEGKLPLIPNYTVHYSDSFR